MELLGSYPVPNRSKPMAAKTHSSPFFTTHFQKISEIKGLQAMFKL